MKLFVCSVCGLITFNEAPERCPVCQASKDKFKEDPNAIKKPGDPSNYQESEKKHIPWLKILRKCGLIPEGCIDLMIKIGEITHPMEEKHYIQYVDLYLDYKFVARTNFAPVILNPATCAHFKAEKGKVSVIEHCNIHGSWMSETDL